MEGWESDVFPKRQPKATIPCDCGTLITVFLPHCVKGAKNIPILDAIKCSKLKGVRDQIKTTAKKKKCDKLINEERTGWWSQSRSVICCMAFLCMCMCVIASIVLPFITMVSQDSNRTEKTVHQSLQVFKQSQTTIPVNPLARETMNK